ncbi:MAG TPA: MaoC/PaaZ C-terminal domain-containing protein [Sporichthya sp.]|nr:MaoC/PaaZ C-terminal domain-containing protein [Sporichthya sp.]
MSIDPRAIGATADPVHVTWTSKDCLLYALGVGAGVDELAFTTENTRGVRQRMLPTMPVVLGSGAGALKLAGTIDWVRLVHAAQGVEVLAPLPVDGEATVVTRIAEMWDKGKAALVTTESTGTAPDGTDLFRTRMTVFIGGAGGWGGERGPAKAVEEIEPESKPDETISYQTRADQALLYRLSGDRNPLHSDPSFAAKAGFERPILHGLCTFGFAGRAVLHTAAGGDPDRLRFLDARFAKPVYPGDTLHIDLWNVPGGAQFRVRTGEDTVVLDRGRATISA